MKRALLAGGLVVALLVGTVWAAYTRDLGGDAQKALLIALEYMISDGIPVNAGTNLNTSALALNASVDGLEAGLGTATTAAVDGDVAGSAVAQLRGINKKLAASVAVTGTFWQTTQPISGAVTTSGTVTEASGSSIATAVQIMDDWDATHGSAAPADGVQAMVAYDSTLPTAVADAAAARMLGDQFGRARVGWEPDIINKSNSSADATGAGMALAIGTASKKAAILAIVVSTDTAMTVTISDEDGNFALAPIYPAARGGAVIPFPASAPWLLPTADKDIKVVASVPGNIGVTVTGYYYP